MADRVIQRHDTIANWQSVNPVLAEGEMGIEIDGAKGYKIGDGKTAWNSLPYPANPAAVVQETGTSETSVISQKVVTEKLTELESEMVRFRLVGDDDNVVIQKIQGLISGNTYRLSFKETSWDITGVTVSSSGMFYLASVFDGNDTYIANALISTGKVNANYEFTIPENCDFIKLQIRATKGVSVWYAIEDITDAKKLYRIVTENNNVSSVKPVNIDTANKVLDFGTDPVLCIGSKSYALKNIHSDVQKYRSIPYYASASSANVIVFNLDTKELYPKQWDYQRGDNEVLIGAISSVYNTHEFLSASFPFAYTIDGKGLEEIDTAINQLNDDVDYLQSLLEDTSVIINATSSSHSSLNDLLNASVRKNDKFTIQYSGLTAEISDSAVFHLTINYADGTSTQQYNLIFNKKYTYIANSDIVSFGVYYDQNSVISDGKIRGTVRVINSVQQNLKNTIRQKFYVKGVNHRGWHEAPENTLIAYKESRKHGFHYVECDVAFTKDNVPVLLHDDTIDRTSNGTGAIAELTYDELLMFDFGGWKGEQYRKTTIPTLESFLILCRNLMLHPYLEIKAYNINQSNVENVVRIVKSCGMRGKVSYISFSLEVLEYIKNIDSDARLGLLSNTLTELDIDNAQSLKTDSNEVFLNVFGVKENTQNVNLCINADIPLEIWTIDTEDGIIMANPYISGFISDNLNAGEVLYYSSSLL